jgi:CxxC motif-containing protein
MKELTCIVCPRGCRLKVDDNMEVTGNACPRGKIYAINELTHPTRTITSSIRVSNRPYTLVSVKTDKPIPKDKMFDVMKEIDKLTVEAPTMIGRVVKANILGLDSNIIITKNID